MDDSENVSELKKGFARRLEAVQAEYRRRERVTRFLGRIQGFVAGACLCGLVVIGRAYYDVSPEPEVPQDTAGFVEGFEEGVSYTESRMGEELVRCIGDNYSGSRDFLLSREESIDYHAGCMLLDRSMGSVFHDLQESAADLDSVSIGGYRTGEVYALESARNTLTDRMGEECPGWFDDDRDGCFYYTSHATALLASIERRMGSD